MAQVPCKPVAGGSAQNLRKIDLFVCFRCSIADWAGVVAWSALGGLLGASWSILGPSWGPLGVVLGVSWCILGLSWSHLGGIGPKPMCVCFSRKACGRGFPFSVLRGVGVDLCGPGAVQTGCRRIGPKPMKNQHFCVFSVFHHRLGWCRGLVRSRGPLGGILVHLGPILGTSWGSLGGILVHLGPILESSWGHLGAAYGPLRAYFRR